MVSPHRNQTSNLTVWTWSRLPSGNRDQVGNEIQTGYWHCTQMYNIPVGWNIQQNRIIYEIDFSVKMHQLWNILFNRPSIRSSVISLVRSSVTLAQCIGCMVCPRYRNHTNNLTVLSWCRLPAGKIVWADSHQWTVIRIRPEIKYKAGYCHCTKMDYIPVKVTLDICGRPIVHTAPGNIQGNLDSSGFNTWDLDKM